MQRPNIDARSDSRSPAQIAAGNGIDVGRELTKGFAAGLIREKAKQIARRAGFSKSDVDDLQQQLIGHVLENLAGFDPAQGHFNVFVKTVVERYTANILRDARAAKRDRRETCSLSMIVDEDEYGPVELSEGQGIFGAGGCAGAIARLLELQACAAPHQGVVVNYQNVVRHDNDSTINAPNTEQR